MFCNSILKFKVSNQCSKDKYKSTTIHDTYCEGCFCVGATCGAEGDHNVDLGLEKRESNLKFN